MNEDEFQEWGMEFINQLDREVLSNPYIKEHWMEGDFLSCKQWLKDKHPEVTDEQWDWVEEFLSEI